MKCSNVFLHGDHGIPVKQNKSKYEYPWKKKRVIRGWLNPLAMCTSQVRDAYSRVLDAFHKRQTNCIATLLGCSEVIVDLEPLNILFEYARRHYGGGFSESCLRGGGEDVTSNLGGMALKMLLRTRDHASAPQSDSPLEKSAVSNHAIHTSVGVVVMLQQRCSLECSLFSGWLPVQGCTAMPLSWAERCWHKVVVSYVHIPIAHLIQTRACSEWDIERRRTHELGSWASMLQHLIILWSWILGRAHPQFHTCAHVHHLITLGLLT